MEIATCISCNREQPLASMVGPYCHTCEHMERLRKTPIASPHKAAMDAIWERAYFAALGGESTRIESSVRITANAAEIANETVRRWSAMCAERDDLILKSMEGE